MISNGFLGIQSWRWKSWAAMALAVATCLACGVWIWSTRPQVDFGRVYRIGYGNDAPVHFKGADGQPSGLAVELLQEAARRSGIQLEWTNRSGFNQAELDLWALHAITPERRKVVHLTEPYLETESCFLVLDESPYQSAQDLMRTRISLSRSLVQRANLGKIFPEATLVPVDGNGAAMEALVSGRADAVFVNQYAVLATLWRAGSRPALRVLPAGVPKVRLALASTFSHARVADALRDSLRQMADAGAVKPIAERWAFFPRPTTDVIGDLANA